MPEVEISPYNVSVEVRDGESLPRGPSSVPVTSTATDADEAGAALCKVHLMLGEVAYERPIDSRVLTDDEKISGICLSCRAVPLTDVVIELQEGDRLRGIPQSNGSSASRRT